METPNHTLNSQVLCILQDLVVIVASPQQTQNRVNNDVPWPHNRVVEGDDCQDVTHGVQAEKDEHGNEDAEGAEFAWEDGPGLRHGQIVIKVIVADHLQV